MGWTKAGESVVGSMIQPVRTTVDEADGTVGTAGEERSISGQRRGVDAHRARYAVDGAAAGSQHAFHLGGVVRGRSRDQQRRDTGDQWRRRRRAGEVLEHATDDRCRDRKSTRLNSSHTVISYAV